jgi:hypothetical protein
MNHASISLPVKLSLQFGHDMKRIASPGLSPRLEEVRATKRQNIMLMFQR